MIFTKVKIKMVTSLCIYYIGVSFVVKVSIMKTKFYNKKIVCLFWCEEDVS